MMAKTLTLDLGTHVGWAWMDGPQVVSSGTYHLASDDELEEQRRLGKERSLDVRFTRMVAFIKEKLALGIDRIVFEDVTFSGSPMQNQLWAGLRAAIWATAPAASAVICCVPVTTLKVFATGNTRADKFAMATALTDLAPDLYQLRSGEVLIRKNGRVADDNEVDAIWLALYAAAVDRGEEDFLSAFQRKNQRREKQRASRRAAKASRKARKAQELAEAKEKRRYLTSAIKTMDRCCGVFRELAPRRLAICPKCGDAKRIPLAIDGTSQPPVLEFGVPLAASAERRPPITLEAPAHPQS